MGHQTRRVGGWRWVACAAAVAAVALLSSATVGEAAVMASLNRAAGRSDRNAISLLAPLLTVNGVPVGTDRLKSMSDSNPQLKGLLASLDNMVRQRARQERAGMGTGPGMSEHAAMESQTKNRIAAEIQRLTGGTVNVSQTTSPMMGPPGGAPQMGGGFFGQAPTGPGRNARGSVPDVGHLRKGGRSGSDSGNDSSPRPSTPAKFDMTDTRAIVAQMKKKFAMQAEQMKREFQGNMKALDLEEQKRIQETVREVKVDAANKKREMKTNQDRAINTLLSEQNHQMNALEKTVFRFDEAQRALVQTKETIGEITARVTHWNKVTNENNSFLNTFGQKLQQMSNGQVRNVKSLDQLVRGVDTQFNRRIKPENDTITNEAEALGPRLDKCQQSIEAISNSLSEGRAAMTQSEPILEALYERHTRHAQEMMTQIQDIRDRAVRTLDARETSYRSIQGLTARVAQTSEEFLQQFFEKLMADFTALQQLAQGNTQRASDIRMNLQQTDQRIGNLERSIQATLTTQSDNLDAIQQLLVTAAEEVSQVDASIHQAEGLFQDCIRSSAEATQQAKVISQRTREIPSQVPSQFSNVKAQITGELGGLNRSIAQAQEVKGDLHRIVGMAEQMKQKLQRVDQLRAIRTDAVQIPAKIAEWEQGIPELDLRIQEATSRLIEAQAADADARRTLEPLRAKVKTLSGSKMQKERQMRESRTVLLELGHDSDFVQASASKMENELRDIVDELDNVKADLDSQSREFSEVFETVERLEKEKASTQKERAEMNTQLNQAKKKMSDMNRQIGQVMSSLGVRGLPSRPPPPSFGGSFGGGMQRPSPSFGSPPAASGYGDASSGMNGSSGPSFGGSPNYGGGGASPPPSGLFGGSGNSQTMPPMLEGGIVTNTAEMDNYGAIESRMKSRTESMGGGSGFTEFLNPATR
eukprot:GHVT01095215.1.p1 GENE.GHVT01095215.1~~GHVT01095215.1.p1  ORF type:complete len:926 (+),score=179.60 GHVT01095215.1:626-3403(+)